MSYKIKNFCKLVAIAYHYDFIDAIVLSLFSIIQAVIPIVKIYYYSRFIDTVLLGYESGNITPFLPQIFVIGILVGTNLFFVELEKIITQRMRIQIQRSFNSMLTNEISELPYSEFENQESLDLIHRCQDKAQDKICYSFRALLRLVSMMMSLAGIMYSLSLRAWWIVGVVIFACVPTVIVSERAGKADYKVNQYITGIKRKYEYLSSVLCDREYAEERNLFQYSDNQQQYYNEQYCEASKRRIGVNARIFIKNKVSMLCVFVAFGFIIGVLVMPLNMGLITGGYFVSIIDALLNLNYRVVWGLSEGIKLLSSGMEYVNEIQLLQNKNINKNKSFGTIGKRVQEIETIEFINVSYMYPNSENMVLDNISFYLKKGKRYAFVGENGAGKSTIIKLLVGLYSNYTGQILINGIELREYKSDELNPIVSVLFQDYVQHELSIGEMMRLGQLDQECSLDTELLHDFEVDKIIEGFSQGEKTKLGRSQIGGVQLSNGQWQKLAMVRAVSSQASLLIMDEPTSSLDPSMEEKMFNALQRRSKSDLSILICHRLAMTKMVDEILVFESGKLIEKGTYDELMKQQGIYYKMFIQQRSWYCDENKEVV